MCSAQMGCLSIQLNVDFVWECVNWANIIILWLDSSKEFERNEYRFMWWIVGLGSGGDTWIVNAQLVF